MKPPVPTDFSSLQLDPRLLAALSALGYEEPTPVQAQAIPPLLAGRDVLAQAATGTGKTAAFALPLLQRFAQAGRGAGPYGLVLVPTRELALQVAEAIHRYGRELGVRVLPIYGGQSIGLQLRALSRGIDVAVATPGRAVDHVKRGSLHLEAVRSVVLDEADEMLDMGFAEDLEMLLDAVPKERQTALFSATFPGRLAAIVDKHLREPEEVRVQSASEPAGEAPRVRQVAYVVPRAHKLVALARVLDLEAPASALVFCRTRNEVDELAEKLAAHGMPVEAIHGGLSQEQRDRVMKRFREGTAELLVATDVAARGLDIRHISHVVNYDVPSSPEVYVHRIGRTGRAGAGGTAITLLEPREHGLLRAIERLTRARIETAAVPTVADLRVRRLELLRASLRETLVAGEHESFRPVVESLAEEYGVLDIAAAALKLAQGEEKDEGPDIPAIVPRKPHEARPEKKPSKHARERAMAERLVPPGEFVPRPPKPRPSAEDAPRPAAEERPKKPWERKPAPGFAKDRPEAGDRPRKPWEKKPFEKPAYPGTKPRFAREGQEEAGRPRKPYEKKSSEAKPWEKKPHEKKPWEKKTFEKSGPATDAPPRERPSYPVKSGDPVRLRIGVGREAGLRPADLVGAIVNEAGLPARLIGAIEIADHHALVELPGSEADRVMKALRQTTLRGWPVKVKRDHTWND